ncbi:MAG: phosphoenolpyruvate carboxykinase (GTP) [Promethearchaeota archaeon]
MVDDVIRVARGLDLPEEFISPGDRAKLLALKNSKVLDVVERFVKICRPAKVTVISDDEEEIAYVRRRAIELGEERPLKLAGHTIHYDGYRDQARDKENTRVLVEEGTVLSKVINTKPRDEGLEEILEIMDGVMEGKECFVRFFCLGPTNSRFSICALQLTDSAYVAHSEDVLYRKGYEQFKRLQDPDDFFYFVHSAGPLEETGHPVSRDIDKRRIYVDLKEGCVLTVNNQYAGNSLGLKKLALRLAIHRANNEDWLAEHMFVMGVRPTGKDRVTYFTGAYPSACGKTSTAMIPGQTIVGDDIAYLRRHEDGTCRAVNIEQGIFGIIKDVNPVDDPEIFRALTTPRETIFSNVLVHDGVPYWLGDGREDHWPEEGENHYGAWRKGTVDEDGNEVPLAHPNARYTIRIEELENADPALHDPEGVPVAGIFYGGRDSDTSPPIFESLSWEHGVFVGATVESETTSATLGRTGVRTPSPMANLDFLVVPLGVYLENHRRFGRSLEKVPRVFATNYFLKKGGRPDGKYLNAIPDKKVWVLWAEGRTNGEFGAVTTPVGLIPRYEDLRDLFRQVFDKEYSEEEYVEQFSIRVDRWLEKVDRVEAMFREEEAGGAIPEFFWEELRALRDRLLQAKEEHGPGDISPLAFA